MDGKTTPFTNIVLPDCRQFARDSEWLSRCDRGILSKSTWIPVILAAQTPWGIMATFPRDAVAAFVVLVCFQSQPLLSRHGSSLAMAEEGPRLTAEQAIAAAHRNASKPGTSFTILWEIIANADMRRVGAQALEQAQAHKIELYENGILVDILRSGGYLFAETNPQTNNVVGMHLIRMEATGALRDVQSECHGVVKLADARKLVKDTSELVTRLYSTRSTEASSLASRFYAGNYPEADQLPDSLFAIPNSLRKTGANPNEVREAAALCWGYFFWAPRYALSMPAFAASPAAAESAAEKKRDDLKSEFLQINNIDPSTNLVGFENIQNERQLQERIELLTRLDRFLEDSLGNEADPTVARSNLSILTMPLRVDVDTDQGGQYLSASPPK